MPDAPTRPVHPIGLTGARKADPCTVVIFGATGDLTRRKLVPALYNLALDGLLPERFALVGAARSEHDGASWSAAVRGSAGEHSRRPIDDDVWNRLAGRMDYCRLGFDDPDGFRALAERLDRP